MANLSSGLNGRPLRPKRTTRLERLSNSASVVLKKLCECPPPVRLASVLMLLVLVTLLAGCATPSAPDQWPKNPQPPQLTEPLPTQSYLSKALQLIESWRSRATGM